MGMTEPVIFAVERHAGGEKSGIYYDTRLPTWLTAKGSDLLVYAVRLDKLPNGAELINRSVAELYSLFVHLRKAGKLPPSNLTEPPVKTQGRKGAILGEWWTPPARTWDASAPAEPYPDPNAVRPRAGYIGLRRGD